MELQEAIELLKPDTEWQPDDFIADNSPMEVGDAEVALAAILNAVTDGTLIPADQCYEVREGYSASAFKNVDLEEGVGYSEDVPLSEALSIRSADDVRREALEEAIRKVDKVSVCEPCGADAINDAILKIRALIDTPQPKGGDDE